MAITQTTDVNVVQAAYNRMLDGPLRAMLLFDQVATEKPSKQSMPGSSVIFSFKADIAANVTPLTENADVTPTTMSTSSKTVTLTEYGDAVGQTRKLKGLSFVPLDPELVDTAAFAAGNSQNLLARVPLEAGTNVLYAKAAANRVGLAATDTVTSTKLREVVARLRTNKARPIDSSGHYAAYIHPHVSKDLREETGVGSWRQPNEYTAMNGRIWNGMVGEYEGLVFIENTECRILVDAGAGGTVDVYQSYFLGQQAVAKAFSSTASGPNAGIEVAPVVDKLNRFFHVGWYWLGGYGRYREEALYRLESSSSLGVNV